VCSQAIVKGERLTYRTEDGSPHYVHANETGDHVWAPIWEIETTIVSVEGSVVELNITRGEMSRIGLIVPGTHVESSLAPGSRVYVAQSSAVREGVGAPIVVIVGLD
jgi:hypothetical protein